MANREEAILGIKSLLEYLGEDTTREGLVDTPERFLKSWEQYWGVGYTSDITEHIKTFNTDNILVFFNSVDNSGGVLTLNTKQDIAVFTKVISDLIKE